MSRTHGFTLIELLVVIAVIVILAALVMPTITTSFEQAERTVCLSNCHQLYIAIKEYAASANSVYADLDLRNEYRWPTPNHCWNPVINKEIDRLGKEVRFCPSNDYTEWHVRQGREWSIYSMGYAIYAGRSIDCYRDPRWVKYMPGESMMTTEPGDILVTDLVRTWGERQFIRDGLRINNHIGPDFAPVGGHCAFADGEVKWTSVENLDWDRAYAEYGRDPYAADAAWTFVLGFQR